MSELKPVRANHVRKQALVQAKKIAESYANRAQTEEARVAAMEIADEICDEIDMIFAKKVQAVE